MKDFKTIEEQITLLKNRGLSFEDEEKAKNILLTHNYYNIINGYKDLFITNGAQNNFLTNSTFEEIFALYNFDKSIKDVILKYILKVENNLRSLIAYYFSMYHGNDNYLKIDSFDNLNNNALVTIENRQKRIENIQSLIGTIQKEIAHAIGTKEYIKHYMMIYGFVPMWVLVNILSFGQLSKFFELMKQNERVLIARHFNIPENELVQHAKMLSYFRNLCAHDERIYNVKLPKYLYIPNSQYHVSLNIPQNNGMYIYGKNDLFALMISLKTMLTPEEYNTMHNKIFGRIKSLERKLSTISTNQVLQQMNFPSNWRILQNL